MLFLKEINYMLFQERARPGGCNTARSMGDSFYKENLMKMVVQYLRNNLEKIT